MQNKLFNLELADYVCVLCIVQQNHKYSLRFIENTCKYWTSNKFKQNFFLMNIEFSVTSLIKTIAKNPGV